MEKTTAGGLYVFLVVTAVVGARELGAAPPKDWPLFEYSSIRFSYPKGYTVKDFDRDPATHMWGILSGKTIKLKINRFVTGVETRPLTKVATEPADDPMKIIAGPTKVIVPGGECYQYRREGVDEACAYDPTDCVTGLSLAVCYNKKKEFFKISSGLFRYSKNGKPDSVTQKDLQDLATLISSIQFKAK